MNRFLIQDDNTYIGFFSINKYFIFQKINNNKHLINKTSYCCCSRSASQEHHQCICHKSPVYSSSSSSSSSRTDLMAHFQQLIASQATNPQPATFSLIHNIQRKREDRRGWSRSLGTTISTTETTHHHHYPPTLTDEKMGGGKKGGRTSENSVALTLTHTLKKRKREKQNN